MSVLEQIIAAKRARVKELSADSLWQAMSRAQDAPPVRRFADALERSHHSPALIAEVKKASPSQGLIRPECDPVEIGESYERAGADAVSILTDERWFQGSAENLIKTRERIRLPVLRKDFTVSEFDIYESRAMGADAILLIVAALDDAELRGFHSLAQELGMDALVEVHDSAELERALAIEPKIVGVNNRNLVNFKEDLLTSHQLLSRIPETMIKVSESSLKSVDDIEAVWAAGARAVLIGTAFCREPDVETAVRRIMGWIDF